MVEKVNTSYKKVLMLLCSGTFLEYFDFALYIHMAVLLNELFFPAVDETSKLILASTTFYMSFVGRIAGGFFFGWIGDKYGRRAVIIIATAFMAITSLTIANLPTYTQIGIIASIIMFLCRILQGISSLGELLGSEIYLMETVRERPLQYSVVASIAIFSSLGGICALSFCSLIFYYEMNWRLAFWFGSVIAIISFMCRKKLSENSDFLNSQKTGLEILKNLKASNEYKESAIKSEILQSTILDPKIPIKTIIAYASIEIPYAVYSFFSIIYCSNILRTQFAYTPQKIIFHNLIVGIIDCIGYVCITFLVYKFFPLLLFRLRLIVFIIFSLLLPYFMDISSSPMELLYIQGFMMFFMPTSACGAPIFFSHVFVGKRFKFVFRTFAISRAIVYVLVSFYLIKLIEYFGYYGIYFLSIPILSFTFWGIHVFFQLEKENGTDVSKWINSPSIYKENFLQPWYQKKKNTEALIKFVTK